VNKGAGQLTSIDGEREGSSGLDFSKTAGLLIVLVAVATRIVAWWNPVAHVDDQFYLLAGEELLKGHWPYVDVWDRKPLGLFLLYAGIAWIGGGSILGLNLVATAFAAATAFVIRQIALRFASPAGATLAALAYLVAMPVFGGQTGQSPVFYNLLMAGAAWLLFRAADQRDTSSIRAHALAAMLLCGLSITIKQVSFVEGAFFGLAFLWLVKRGGANWVAIIATGALMVAIALLPYALTMAGYALAGETALRDFVYANFISIFERRGWQPIAKVAGAAYFILYLLPLLGMGGWGALSRWRSRRHDLAQLLLLGWLAASLLGYLAVPAFFDHYTLPVLVPLCISAATFFDRSTRWAFFSALVIFYLLEGSITDFRHHQRDRQLFDQLRQQVDQARHGGCIYVADGPSWLYSVTTDCRLTRYLFPDHLNLITEEPAVGTDTANELALIMAQRPAVIVTQDKEPGRYSFASRGVLENALNKHYTRVFELPKIKYSEVNGVQVWQRNDLPPPPKN
jgi:hypothetical protein